ncbi:DUF4974 domain-containing protein [Chitinophaga oryzae]|uniref:DUF4974 domain-containing protein n=1 Tax=Chitinophaga oryzae TaxID=2725414 RepID=A0AAE6ZF11_9BACT|nr:FecR domain-containing protein [Chitinophaga oryzae]QJB31763.1 DUF4974 domain-containing protein [Chitinophaga oryzae]QJB38247.1 DUF4974 domain-containing protein [Chitinophaga oryzae]
MHEPITIEHLVHSDSFIACCLQKDAQAIRYWQQRRKEHPEHQAVFDSAELLVLSLYRFGMEQDLCEQEERLKMMIQPPPAITPANVRKTSIRIAAAASLALLILTGIYLFTRPKPAAWVVLSSPAGQLRHVTLPDGSTAWLYSGSSIRYQQPFAVRSIQLLEGEACFRVVHDSLHPFSVQLPSGRRVTDLGTAFSVQSYGSLPEERIGVAEGSVQADTFSVLHAGEGIVAAKRSGEWKSIPYRSTTADWAQGNISLQDASFGELQLVLEQTYGLTIIPDTPAVAACRITTSFRRSDNIHQILDALRLIYGITYTIKGNTVHLSGTGCAN